MNFTEAVRLLKLDEQNFIMRKGKKKERIFLDDDSGRLKTNSWLLLTNDILANDWEVYEQPKLHTFEEALKALKKGKVITREYYKTNIMEGYIAKYKHKIGEETFDNLNHLSRIDILANDWIIEENYE